MGWRALQAETSVARLCLFDQLAICSGVRDGKQVPAIVGVVGLESVLGGAPEGRGGGGQC
jgi:hypothetical protein